MGPCARRACTTFALAALVACGSDDSLQVVDAGGPDATLPTDGAVPNVDSGVADAGTSRDGAGTDAAPTPVDSGIDAGASVLEFHLHPSRDGHYVDPLMTSAHAQTMHIDPTFDGTIASPMWSQPLYVEAGPGGHGVFIVASDSNDVYALDETSGKPVWHQNLGPPATNLGFSSIGCGNVHPVGVTGTPVIDLGQRTIYLDSATGDDAGLMNHHWVHALSLDDGTERTGAWPVDINVVSPQGYVFFPNQENQRGALALVNGYLYVPYGGVAGDCGDYHGWVVSIAVASASVVSNFATTALQGGMWAAGGISSDGTDLFVTSGNTVGTNGVWGGGETVFRFHDGTAFDPSKTTNYFYPSDWFTLDTNDTDLGASNPMVVDVPDASPSRLVVQFGKNGVMYLLDRANLGGGSDAGYDGGNGVANAQVAVDNNATIINAGATYTTASGTYVVFWGRGYGANCPVGQSGDLIAVKIGATSPPTISTVWCQIVDGDSGPIVTTTDATSNPIVWITGADGDFKLHAFDGETGNVVFDGGAPTDIMGEVVHFTSPIEVKGRVFVGGSGRLYAFKGQ